MSDTGTSLLTISELREFAGFSPAEQRYIKRSLDVGLGRADAYRLWARDASEVASIRSQHVMYQDLDKLRGHEPDEAVLAGMDDFMGILLRITAFDLAQERLSCFSAYRFLYERLLGAAVRPWLPAAFCGASALPQIRPFRRKMLLQTLSEAAATAPGWSEREPRFFPGFVEAVEAA